MRSIKRPLIDSVCCIALTIVLFANDVNAANQDAELLFVRRILPFISGPTKELTSSNAPLRGGKGELWEGGIRMPLIISWKREVPAGRVIDVPVTSIDVTATAMELGGTTLDNAKFDGASLLPLLSGKTVDFPHRNLFWRLGKKNALRSGDWKLIGESKEWQLYDLAQDIGETTNLAANEPARVQQLDAMWNQWNSEQAEPLEMS